MLGPNARSLCLTRRSPERELLAREFPIDASPVALSAPTCGRPGAATQGPDFLSQVRELMLLHEEVERRAHRLESQGRHSESRQLESLLRRSLTVLDSFDRVLQMAEQYPPSEEMANWLKTVAAIQGRMTELLGEFGLRPMDPVGKPVDLDRHEVVEVRCAESLPDETVVEVRQRGYLLNGKVLRDARVVVAQNPS